jgi:2-keto-4-pentenoate hydratase
LVSLKWLIGKLESRGLNLEEGMIVSSRTFVLLLRLEKGTYRGSYSSLGDVILVVE